MPPDLHLHPDRLRAHRAAASGLAEELHAALRGAPVDGAPIDGGAIPFEQERLLGAVGAAVCELAELSAALGDVAAAATAAEAEIGERFRQVLDPERA
jgi:hypothetical protein